MPDIEVLDLALKWIEDNPEQHNQRVWVEKTTCGTAMCLAGVIAWQAGHEFHFYPAPGRTRYRAEAIADGGGKALKSIAWVAEELLGVDLDTSRTLFASTNTLADLKSMRDELVSTGKIERRF